MMRRAIFSIRLSDDRTRAVLLQCDIPVIHELENGARWVASQDYAHKYLHPEGSESPVSCSAEYVLPPDIAAVVGITAQPVLNAQHVQLKPGESLTLIVPMGHIVFQIIQANCRCGGWHDVG